MIAAWLPQGFSFLSGLPEAKRRRIPLVILQAYVDESGTRNQDACMTFAGFISPAEEWAEFSNEWQRCLDAPPTLKSFKMREAANNPSGEFRNWKKDDVRRKVRELVQIIRRHAKLAIHCTTSIRDFDALFSSQDGPLANPYCLSFYAILTGIGYEAAEMNAERLELIFDQHDKYARLVKSVYPYMKKKCDPELARMLPVEPLFRDDVEFLPLQAADLLAWLFRKAFNGLQTEWEWIAGELMPAIPMSRYSTLYTRDRLENVHRMTADVVLTPEETEELGRLGTWLRN